METYPTTNLNPDQLLRADQVADRLNISRALAYRLMKSGLIPTVRFIGSVRVSETDLQAFIDAHRLTQ